MNKLKYYHNPTQNHIIQVASALDGTIYITISDATHQQKK